MLLQINHLKKEIIERYTQINEIWKISYSISNDLIQFNIFIDTKGEKDILLDRALDIEYDLLNKYENLRMSFAYPFVDREQQNAESTQDEVDIFLKNV